MAPVETTDAASVNQCCFFQTSVGDIAQARFSVSPPLPPAVGFFAGFSPSGEQQKVPSFHLSQTPSEAFPAGDEAVTCQGQLPPLHSSSLGYSPELWPWIWPAVFSALPLSSRRHMPSTAPAPHSAGAGPRADCAVPLGAPVALLPSHLCQEPRCFSFEGVSWRGAVFPHPLLQPQCCFQRSLDRKSGRVQAEHDARPPFLALDLPARLRSAVPDTRCQLHRRALQHAVLLILSQNCHVAAKPLPTRVRKGDRAAPALPRALPRACS